MTRSSFSARSRLAALVVAAGAVLLGATGCGGAAHAAKTQAAVALRGPTVNDSSDHVSFRLPSGWVDVPFGDAMSTVLRQHVRDQSLADEIFGEIQRGQLQGLKAFALDGTQPTHPVKLDFAVTGATGTTLDSLANLLKLQFTRLGATNAQLDKLTIGDGSQVLRATYTLQGNERVAQYYKIAGGMSYGLTFTVPPGAKADSATLDAIAGSLRLG